ncbi:GNAT family N-acetyltransferase [Pelomonas sp. APW6]|uniref:GNAT family N-acetyltransferase n=1 Tax=Roseateles subflavus TaxID=3053353 RepID=A0ABT7LJ49_9BURK|nr:GNAT family N-acetyltransferase [Pelomonas sp. APW6]MDL5032853.1 GNAT family N-acetyltransferase [Pelomonas sp. APW6]
MPLQLRHLSGDRPGDLAIVDAVLRSHPTFGRRSLYHPTDAALFMRSASMPCTPEQLQVFAVVKRGKVCGVAKVLLHVPDARTALLDLLMIQADATGQGLGSEALEHLSVKARRWTGINRWQLMVLDCHTRAQAFWRAQGFQLTRIALEAEGPEGRGQGATVHWMERPLRRPSSARSQPPCRSTGRGSVLAPQRPQ